MKKVALISAVLLVAVSVLFSLGGPLLWSAPARASEDAAAPAEMAGGKYLLKVKIEGLPPIAVRGMEGLEVNTEVVEFKDSSLSNRLRKLPGRTTFANIRLKVDPVPAGDSLWKWYSDTMSGKIERKKMSVILSREGKDLRRYDFTEAWPCKWEGPRQVAADQAAEDEQVTITYETIERLSV